MEVVMTNRGASLQVDPAHSTEYKLLLPSLKPSRLQAEKEEQVMLTYSAAMSLL